MESAHFRQLYDLTHRRRHYLSWQGRVFAQGEVSSGVLVVAEIGTQYAAQMCLIKDDDVIETLTPDGSDEALDVGILPR